VAETKLEEKCIPRIYRSSQQVSLNFVLASCELCIIPNAARGL